MRSGVKDYLLREYGSWSVLIISYVIGLGVSREFVRQAVPVFLALGLLINSKQAFTRWNRRAGDRKAFAVFLAQLIAAAAIIIAIAGSGTLQLLPLLVFPAAYLIVNRTAGEHNVFTELLGFALLSLAAVIAKFLVVGGLDVRLFVAVALYFTVGVFKVKAVLFKQPLDRLLSVLYILFAAYAYHRFHISLLILLPLAENLVMAAFLYKVRLQTTGWIEVAKSLLFLGLMLWLF